MTELNAANSAEATVKNAIARDKDKANKDASKKTTSSPSEQKAVLEFRRSQLVNEQGTGVTIDRKTGKKTGEYDATTEKVKITEPLKQQYTRFLSGYTENLIRALKDNPADIFTNEKHIHDRDLLTFLADLTKQGEANVYQINETKIQKFLSTPEGWMVATQLMEHQTALQLYALSLEAAMRPSGTRKGKADVVTIRTGVGQGGINKLIVNVSSWLGEPTSNEGGRSGVLRRWHIAMANTLVSLGGSLGYTLLGRPDLGIPAAALIAGGTVAAEVGIYGAERLIGSALRQGLRLDVKTCTDAFNAIAGDPTEAAYVKAIFNIDTTPDAVPLVDPEEIKNQALQNLYTREAFYTALGVPAQNLDALPEQFLLRANPSKLPEQTNTVWQADLQDNYKRIHAARIAARIAAAGAGAPPPPPPTVAENLQDFMQARREMMLSMMQDYAKMYTSEYAELDKAKGAPVTAIAEKIKEMQPNGSLRKKQEEQFDKRKTELTGVKTETDKLKDAITEYDTAQTALQEAQKALAAEFPGIAFDQIDTNIHTLQMQINDRNDANSIVTRRSDISRRQNQTVQQSYQDTINAIGGAVTPDVLTGFYNIIKAQADALTQGELELLNQEAEALRAKIARLNELKTTITTAEKTAKQKEDDILGKPHVDTAVVATDHATLTGWAAGGVTIQDMDLRTQTLDEILIKINTINAVIGAQGWPADQNNNPANRLRVIHAITEAKSQFNEILDQEHLSRVGSFQNMINPVSGFTEAQLRTLTDNQLIVLAHQKNVANPAHGWSAAQDAIVAPILTKAIQEARSRLVLRHRIAVGEELDDLDSQIQAVDKAKTAISFEQQVRVLETTKELMSRQGEVFSLAALVTADRNPATNKYFDAARIDPNSKEYSDAEKALYADWPGSTNLIHLPQGYIELMDVLFGYKQKSDRDAYFLKIVKVLPPAEFARIMQETLELTNLPDPLQQGAFLPWTLDNTMTAIRYGLRNGKTSSIEVRKGFREVIDTLRRQAEAI